MIPRERLFTPDADERLFTPDADERLFTPDADEPAGGTAFAAALFIAQPTLIQLDAWQYTDVDAPTPSANRTWSLPS